MPIYEYRCEACGARFDEYLSTPSAPPPHCGACGSADVGRLWSSFATEWKPSNVNWHRVGGRWGEKPPKRVF
jgi:putative FmdB family regulatory protein